MKKILTYAYTDDWARPTFKDEDGNRYKDTNCGRGERRLCTVTSAGEPDCPFHGEYEIKANPLYVAIMAGHNLGTERDGYPTDMVSYRNRLIFCDTDGKVVIGDVAVGTRWDYRNGKNCGIAFPCLMCWDLQYEGICPHTGIDYRATWRYRMPSRERHYTQKDLLEAVNEVSCEYYTEVRFVEDYEEWEKIPAIKQLHERYKAA